MADKADKPGWDKGKTYDVGTRDLPPVPPELLEFLEANPEFGKVDSRVLEAYGELVRDSLRVVRE